MPRKADDNIMLRVEKAHKALIKQAAELVGMSVSAFMLGAALSEATRLLCAECERENAEG